MKYTFVLPVLMFFMLSSLHAQLTVKTAKTFPTYSTGETATFQITSTTGGSATYQFVYDEYKELGAELPITLSPGVPAQVSTTLYQPGVVTCKVKLNGTTVRGAALFNHQQIQPARTEPADFDAFWEAQKQLLSAVPIAPALTYHVETSTSTTYKISLGHIDGRRVYGWLSVPKGGTTYPAVVHFPSFGSTPQNPVAYMADQLGCLAFSLTIHNAPADQTDPMAYQPNDPSSATGNYYRYAVLAGIRAIDYLTSRSDFNGTEVAVFGESQGGGLSVMVAGLDSRVDLCITGIDALAEHSAWLDGKASSFPYYLQTASYSNNQNYVSAVANAVKYYDAIYFQKRFKGKSLCTIGHQDEICPPATTIAKNNQAVEKMVTIHALEQGHATPIYFWKALPDFIRAHFPSTNSPANNPWIAATKGYQYSGSINLTGTTGTGLYINGTFTHDGVTVSGATAKWEKVSGSGTAQFDNANALNPTVTFSADDNYVLKVTLTDQSRAASDKIVAEYVEYIKVVVGAGGPGGGGGNGGGSTVLCGSAGQEPWWQWIEKVAIGSTEHTSLKEGYANFSNFSIVLPEGSTQTISLTPGYSFTQFTETWRVWADWNQNNDFTDAGELIYEQTGVGTVSGQINIPAGLAGKQIKLRVAMKNGAAPSPCETFQYGEVEDYLMTILAGTGGPSCAISATNTTPVCDQNGTPFLSADDSWSVNITASNTDNSLTNFTISYNGISINGGYNTPVQITGLAFGAASTNFVLSDASNSNCSYTLAVTPPAPCVQAQLCSITYEELGKECQINGTPYSASDDTWLLTCRVTNSNSALTQFNYVVGGQTLTGTYGQTFTIQRPMNGQALSLNFTDQSNNTCSRAVSVTPPAPCVQVQPCSITYEELGKECQINGTPYSASDDTWLLTCRVTNSNSALTQFNYIVGGQTLTGTYGQTFTIQRPMNGQTLNLNFTDQANNTCSRAVSVTPPAPCVQVQPCSIVFEEISKQCQNNGTPGNSNDDTWLLTFKVTNANTALGQYRYTYNGVTLQATYGQTRTIQRPMNGQNLSLSLQDLTVSGCNKTVSVVPPAPCTGNTPCSIVYTEISKVCNQNGTPYSASDDTWTVSFRVTNQNTSLTNYSYTYNGIIAQGTYGQDKSVTLPMSTSSLNIAIADASQSSCTLTVSIAAPAACVVVLPPQPVPYCSVNSAYPWEEWIAGVRVGSTWIKYSGKEGYADFTATVGTIKAGFNEIRVLNQFSFVTAPIYTKIWIDANKDGVFAANELVVSRTTSAPASRNMATSTMIATINVPSNWFSGTTRMRIICSKEPIIDACTNLNRGEIEDYTLSYANTALVSSNQPNPGQMIQFEPLQLFPNPAHHLVHVAVTQFQHQNLTVQLLGTDQVLYYQDQVEDLRGDTYSIPLEGLTPGMYYVRIIMPGERPITQKLMVISLD